MKTIEVHNLTFAIHKVEAVQLIYGNDVNIVKIFMGSYGHILSFEDREDEAESCYLSIIDEMNNF